MSSPRPTALLLALAAVAALAVGAGGYDPDLGGDTSTEHRATLTPAGGDADFGESSGPGPGGGSGPPPLWPEVDPDTGDERPSPDLRLLVGAALVVAGGAVAVYALTGDGREADRSSDGDETAAPTVGYRDPGTNGVYRSWARLREHVGDDETATPAELARRAGRMGAPADAVSELTTLFRRVRYGDEDATERAERRASAAADRATDDGADQ
ncbi:DUF4129 domain-containing protein [Halorarius halobius]|uniref:DUF4129 domain-containing protein n=1 Tax=Halorarius halobius TaxID=2962671 RepID=UPI0020CEC33F|nr:DUF4129 domain-containing protein [Halorarius halobius]